MSSKKDPLSPLYEHKSSEKGITPLLHLNKQLKKLHRFCVCDDMSSSDGAFLVNILVGKLILVQYTPGGSEARGRMVPGQEFNAMSQGDRHKRAVPLSRT